MKNTKAHEEIVDVGSVLFNRSFPAVVLTAEFFGATEKRDGDVVYGLPVHEIDAFELDAQWVSIAGFVCLGLMCDLKTVV